MDHGVFCVPDSVAIYHTVPMHFDFIVSPVVNINNQHFLVYSNVYIDCYIKQ